MEDVWSDICQALILGDDLRAVAPIWADLVEFGETNAVIKRIFGWVRDMYAFDFAVRTSQLCSPTSSTISKPSFID